MAKDESAFASVPRHLVQKVAVLREQRSDVNPMSQRGYELSYEIADAEAELIEAALDDIA